MKQERSDSGANGFLHKLLLLMGRFCPVCNFGKLIPNTEIGRRLTQRQNNCPACQAYRKSCALNEEEDESAK